MIQPGVETSPPGGLVGGVGEVGGVSGAGGAGGLDGLLGVSDFEDKLKAAPADVRAAAERLSLISAAADGIGGMDGIVTRAPGLDSTDTGKLSVSEVDSRSNKDKFVINGQKYVNGRTVDAPPSRVKGRWIG